MSSALYPSLEDMKVDQYLKSQEQGFADVSLRVPYGQETLGLLPTAPPLTLPRNHHTPHAKNPFSSIPETSDDIELGSKTPITYPQILDEYMGLQLYQGNGANHPTEVTTCLSTPAHGGSALPGADNFTVVAPLSGSSLGHQRSALNGGIREVILCKDEKGKVGLRLRSVKEGIFVLIVAPHSPASLAGIKFGDQVVQIDTVSVAGMDSDKVEKIIKKARHDVIYMVVRDRPFERTITMHKDSNGYMGFVFKHGRITNIVRDSSAARNGLLIDQYLLEINGKNVVGLKDGDIKDIFEKSGNSINLTIMPAYIFEHMIKNLSLYTVRKSMDRALNGTDDL